MPKRHTINQRHFAEQWMHQQNNFMLNVNLKKMRIKKNKQTFS